MFLALLSVSPSLSLPQLTLSVTIQYLPGHHLYAWSNYLGVTWDASLAHMVTQ